MDSGLRGPAGGFAVGAGSSSCCCCWAEPIGDSLLLLPALLLLLLLMLEDEVALPLRRSGSVGLRRARTRLRGLRLCRARGGGDRRASAARLGGSGITRRILMLRPWDSR